MARRRPSVGTLVDLADKDLVYAILTRDADFRKFAFLDARDPFA
jgi:hypothetical protein